ncbi:amino acid-binding protein [Shewanella sp.]|nr:amino acid-binding protein [Shewanella sp.]
MLRLLVTLQTTDREGLVEQIAHTISHYGGHWLDSELRHIDGIFAAILLLEAPTAQWEALIDTLKGIEGVSLTVAKTKRVATSLTHLSYSLVAYDRPGLVHEISNKISALGINIERMSTCYESASHTGIALFRAEFNVGIKDPSHENQLTEALHAIGDDVVLDPLSA